MPLLFHDTLVEKLRTFARNDSDQHAYLFIGPEHIGKRLLAERFAHVISSGNDAPFVGDDFKAGEVIVVGPNVVQDEDRAREKPIEVEMVRDIRRFLSLSSFGGSRRVCVIDNAHTMTIQSQNAILKTLEEPPHGAVLALVTHRPGEILSTIVSRCRIVECSLPRRDDFVQWIREEGITEADEMEALSIGRTGIAMTLMRDQGERERRKEWLGVLENLQWMDAMQRLNAAEEMTKDPIALREMLHVWQYFLRCQAFGNRNKIQDNYRFIDRIEGIRELLFGTNANKRLLMEAFLLAT